MSFESDSILFGTVQIRYYGIIIVTAMLVAAWIASRLAERTKRDSDHIWGALTWAIFPGIVLARLWFILLPPASLTAPCFNATPSPTDVCRDTLWFLTNFFDLNNGAIAVWNGGLHIYGAVLGGLLGVWLYFSRHHHPVARFFHIIFGILPGGPVIVGLLFFVIPAQLSLIWRAIFIGTLLAWLWPYGAWLVKALQARSTGETVPFELPKYESNFPAQGMPLLPWLDIAAVALPLAQAIGRWANYINQELYGTPTGSSWFGIAIDVDHRVGIYKNSVNFPLAGDNQTLFHPLFLYESLWNLLAFFVLLNLYNSNREKFRQGDFFLLFIVQYGVIRFLLEFLRVEQAFLFGVNTSQVLAAVMAIVALAIFFMRKRGGDVPYEDKALATAAE